LDWTVVSTPAKVIVSAVALDDRRPDVIYIGAANETAIYRSSDNGRRWLRIPLSDEYTGSVTDIAVNGLQRLIYVGTDTAGLFRLRDVGSSVVLTAHFALGEPVLEVATESAGAGMAFARTTWRLYRGEYYGVAWLPVENLGSVPTALAIANTRPATVYVGTLDRGVVQSQDGLTWISASTGLGQTPGSRLAVNDLSVDPAQPDVLYVATSYLFGHTTVHRSPAGVAMSTDGGQNWFTLFTAPQIAPSGHPVELLPVSGQTGAVYALTAQSRRPLALGRASLLVAETSLIVPKQTTGFLAWKLAALPAWPAAGLGALACVFVFVSSLRKR
jgi:photosystem II stability/assembly factor-like uncharacterized protein